MALFSEQEIRRRWQAVLSGLDRDVECLVAGSFAGAYYLSGVPIVPLGRQALMLLFRDAEPALIVPEVERPAAEADSPVERILSYDDRRPPLASAVQLAARELHAHRVRNAALDWRGSPAALHVALSRALYGIAWRDASSVIDRRRLVSSSEEIEYVRSAAAIVREGLAAAPAEIDQARTTADAGARVGVAMARALDCEAPASFEVVVAQGELADIECHRDAGAVELVPGRPTQLLCECSLAHYRAMAARPLIVDAPAAVEAAFAAVLAEARPGRTFAQLEAASRSALTANGEGRVVTGGGMAYGLINDFAGRIDEGDLRAYNTELLRPGMLLMIEPWMRSAAGALRRADTVLVTPEGSEVLTEVARVESVA
jgi:Xaa-Pro dipeptidase